MDLNSKLFELKAMDDHVGGQGANATAGEDHKDQEDDVLPQHRDSMEDTK